MFKQLNSRFTIVVLSFSLFLVYVTANAPTPLYMLWQQSIHYSTTGISVIFIVYHLGIAFSLLTFSRIKQVKSVKKMLLLSLLGSMLASVLFASASYYWQLVAARILIGICSGIFVACGISLIIHIGLKQNVQNTPLIVTLSCVLGFGLGPFYAGVIADHISNPGHWIFYPLTIALVLCWLLLAPMKVDNRQDKEQSHNNNEPPAPINIKDMFIIVALFGSPFALSGLFISLGPNMIADLMHNHSRTVAGAIPLLLFGSGTIAQLALNRLSINKQIGIGVVTATLGALGIWLAEVDHSVTLMTLAAIFAGMGQSLTQLAGTYLMKLHRPMGTMAKSTSTFFLGGYLFAATTIFFLGLMSTHFGLLIATEIFLVACILLLAFGTVGYAIRQSQLQEQHA